MGRTQVTAGYTVRPPARARADRPNGVFRCHRRGLGKSLKEGRRIEVN